MKILTFDTALNKTYISLSENNTIIENLTIENNEDKYHSAFLIKEIAELLKRNNLIMQNINAIGINVGPGSFTGIRACTTVGRVIAQQVEIPLVPVSSLEILSLINPKKGTKTLVTLDARKNSAFVGVFENENTIEPPKIVSVEELISMAKSLSAIIIGDTKICAKLIENGLNPINYETENYPLNEFLAKLTYKKLNCSKDPNTEFNWAKVKPLYIQPPSVFGGNTPNIGLKK